MLQNDSYTYKTTLCVRHSRSTVFSKRARVSSTQAAVAAALSSAAHTMASSAATKTQKKKKKKKKKKKAKKQEQPPPANSTQGGAGAAGGGQSKAANGAPADRKRARSTDAVQQAPSSSAEKSWGGEWAGAGDAKKTSTASGAAGAGAGAGAGGGKTADAEKASPGNAAGGSDVHEAGATNPRPKKKRKRAKKRSKQKNIKKDTRPFVCGAPASPCAFISPSVPWQEKLPAHIQAKVLRQREIAKQRAAKEADK